MSQFALAGEVHQPAKRLKMDSGSSPMPRLSLDSPLQVPSVTSNTSSTLSPMNRGGPAKCPYCEVVVARHCTLRRHIDSKHMKKRLRCTICRRSVKWRQDFNKHMKTHGIEKDFKNYMEEIVGDGDNDETAVPLVKASASPSPVAESVVDTRSSATSSPPSASQSSSSSDSQSIVGVSQNPPLDQSLQTVQTFSPQSVLPQQLVLPGYYAPQQPLVIAGAAAPTVFAAFPSAPLVRTPSGNIASPTQFIPALSSAPPSGRLLLQCGLCASTFASREEFDHHAAEAHNAVVPTGQNDVRNEINDDNNNDDAKSATPAPSAAPSCVVTAESEEKSIGVDDSLAPSSPPALPSSPPPALPSASPALPSASHRSTPSPTLSLAGRPDLFTTIDWNNGLDLLSNVACPAPPRNHPPTSPLPATTAPSTPRAPDSSSRSTQLRCSRCARSFTNMRSLRMHFAAQHTERRILCKICRQDFKYNSSATYHLRKQHNITDNFADYKRVEGEPLDDDEMQLTNFPADASPLRDSRFRSPSPSIVGGDDDDDTLVPCAGCGRGHPKEFVRLCQHCHRLFRCTALLRRHLWEMHRAKADSSSVPSPSSGVDLSHRCFRCNMRFGCSDSLALHLKHAHDAALFVCRLCGAAFQDATIFASHSSQCASPRSRAAPTIFSPAAASTWDAGFAFDLNEMAPMTPMATTTPVESPCADTREDMTAIESSLTSSDFQVADSASRAVFYKTDSDLTSAVEPHPPPSVAPTSFFSSITSPKRRVSGDVFDCENDDVDDDDDDSLLGVGSNASSSTPLKGGKVRGHYPCDKCSKVYQYRATLKLHSEFVHDRKGFACPLCDKIFPRADHLQEHNEEIHLKLKFTCDLCGESFDRKRIWRTHFPNVHNMTPKQALAKIAATANS